MRTNVTFLHPAEFVPVSEDDGILAASAAAWFVDLLKRIHGLSVIGAPIQEDWGVVIAAARNNCRFWIGLSFWPEGESAWLAHVHHASGAWLQRFTSNGKNELQSLVFDLHTVLKGDSQVREVAWYLESEMAKPDAIGATTPDAA